MIVVSVDSWLRVLFRISLYYLQFRSEEEDILEEDNVTDCTTVSLEFVFAKKRPITQNADRLFSHRDATN